MDTRLIFIMVESLKYCQKLYENVYFVLFAGNTLNQDGQNSEDHFMMVGSQKEIVDFLECKFWWPCTVFHKSFMTPQKIQFWFHSPPASQLTVMLHLIFTNPYTNARW